MLSPRLAVIFPLSLALTSCCGGELSARRFNLEQECVEEVENVGCPAEKGGDCDDVVTVAESQYGSLWRFPSNCLPKDFEVVEGRFADLIVQAPLCEDATQ